MFRTNDGVGDELKQQTEHMNEKKTESTARKKEIKDEMFAVFFIPALQKCVSANTSNMYHTKTNTNWN